MPEVGSDLPTTFGKYYLTEKLATGGMAEIYLGKLIGPGGFEKSLVIKQIHPKLSGQRRFVDLFVAEWPGFVFKRLQWRFRGVGGVGFDGGAHR